MSLKPCPFCGGPAKTTYVRDGRQAFCVKCGASGAPRYHGLDGPAATDGHAIKAWNTRDPIAVAREALRGLLAVCSCSNGCPPDDMTCATNAARAALKLLDTE